MKRLLLILFRKVNIVALVLAVLVLFGCGERVEAAEEFLHEDVVYNGNRFFLYKGYFEQTCASDSGYNYVAYVPSDNENVICFFYMYGNNYQLCVVNKSNSEVSVERRYYRTNGTVDINTGIKVSAKTALSYNLSTIFYEYANSTPSVSDPNTYKSLCQDFCNSAEFADLFKVRPELDFNSALDASWVWIEDFRASLEEDTIYMTWGEFKSTLIAAVDELKTYENRYIGLSAYFRDERYETDKSYDDYIITDVVYEEYGAYEGSITFEDFEVPDGYRLLYLYAYPFWYWNDDVTLNLQKGKVSMITFDKDGKSNNALIKDVNDIYNPIDPDFSNWNAITNFTGNYFNNMQQTFDNTFQNYDASGMDDNTYKLGGGLRRYQGEQDAIIDGVSANIEQFNPGDYLNFSEQIVVAMGMASGWINQFLDVSADFTTVFIVGCIMVVIFVVIGIWRFQ